MSANSDVDFTEDRLFPLGWGFIFKVVCAPKSWTPERVSEEATRMYPPGTQANRWIVSDPDPDRTDDFKGVNQLPCPDCADRVHWLINC